MSQRVLFVAYAYPPTGGAGVQRTAKFVKYLPRCGWTPSVLTVANPSVPVIDESLNADVSNGALVRRARTLEPGYALKAAISSGQNGAAKNGGARRLAKRMAWQLSRVLLQPDPQVLWLPGAIREGERLLKKLAHAAIVATAPPFSSLLIGATLSRRTGLPLVLDYRDEWDLSSAYSENRRADPFSRWLQGAMQRQVVRRAGALVATTRSSAEALERIRRAGGGRARVTWIYNGYDPDDFPEEAQPASKSDRYRVAYVGTLWNLTSIEPLVKAIRLLGERYPDLCGRLELVVAGRRTPPQQAVLEQLRNTPCRLIEHPYIDHHQAVELMRSADDLCVILADVPGAERVVPAKIFESMATRRPVLVIAPRGELWDIVADYPSGRTFAPADVEGICRELAAKISKRRSDTATPPVEWEAARYDRRHQAQQLADLLSWLVGSKCSKPYDPSAC
jgi:glycosyltransferase involved in cell wall biosynthesis